MGYRKAEIRSFRPEDEPLLFGLARMERGADERTLAVLEHETVFVAEVGGEAAGYVALEQHADVVRIEQVFVSDEHAGEEIEGQLLDFAEGYAIWRSARALQAVVEKENELAQRLFRGRGFVPVGEDVLELVLPQRQ